MGLDIVIDIMIHWNVEFKTTFAQDFGPYSRELWSGASTYSNRCRRLEGLLFLGNRFEVWPHSEFILKLFPLRITQFFECVVETREVDVSWTPPMFVECHGRATGVRFRHLFAAQTGSVAVMSAC